MLIMLRRMAVDPKWSLFGLCFVLLGLTGVGLIGDGVAHPGEEGSVLGIVLGILMIPTFGGGGVMLVARYWVVRTSRALIVEFDWLRLDRLVGVSACNPLEDFIPSYCPAFVFSGPEGELYLRGGLVREEGDVGPAEVCVAAEGLRVLSFLPGAQRRAWRRAGRLAGWLQVPVVALPASAVEQGMEPMGDWRPAGNYGEVVGQVTGGLFGMLARWVMGLFN